MSPCVHQPTCTKCARSGQLKGNECDKQHQLVQESAGSDGKLETKGDAKTENKGPWHCAKCLRTVSWLPPPVVD